jgi:putative glycosyltransferase (TIGR04348 family)
VRVDQVYGARECDLLVALHARRSFPSVASYRQRCPQGPLVVALTGTDLYADLRTSARARQSVDLADRLILLQPAGIEELPPAARWKARVIYQSVQWNDARTVSSPRQPGKAPAFRVCVLGHLRPVKDPFRTALAARRLPASSRIEVVHVGGALTTGMAERARREEGRNPRYRWLGELPRARALKVLAGSDLLVLTSKVEGGANAISEAVVLGVPVVSSRISGSIGLLGAEYPGYFAVGDTDGLAALLSRVEADHGFRGELKEWGGRLRPLFEPARERHSWRELLAKWGIQPR